MVADARCVTPVSLKKRCGGEGVSGKKREEVRGGVREKGERGGGCRLYQVWMETSKRKDTLE